MSHDFVESNSALQSEEDILIALLVKVKAKMMRKFLALWLVMLSIQPLFAEETVFHVTSTGNESGAGTEAAPFASIAHAQLKVREKIAAGLTGNIRVLIHGGTYELAQPLTFDSRDSGTAQYSITYAAISNETVVVSGGRRITNWIKGDGKIWTAELPEVKEGRWYFRDLYVNNHRAIRARSPNLTDRSPWYTLKAFDKNTWTMTLGVGQVSVWKNLPDVEIVVVDHWASMRKRLRYAVSNPATVIPEPPFLNPSCTEIRAGLRCYLENARAFLDQPGEWYLDRATSILSYWPQPGENLITATVIAPRLLKLLEVRGTFQRSVENLHFAGLHFYHVEPPFPPIGYSSASHGLCRMIDYDPSKVASNISESVLMADKTARAFRIGDAVCFEFAHACSIENSELAHVGGNALCIDNGCSDITVRGNQIYDAGDNGITLGFIRYTPTPLWPSTKELCQSNQVVNNEIFNCGVTYLDGTPVLLMPANQILIANNSIHDCPHNGISIVTDTKLLPLGIADGYWIKDNEIHDVVKMIDDGGGTYLWGRQGANGVISGNAIHDINGRGLYFDDATSGYRIESNVFYRLKEPLFFLARNESLFILRDNYILSPKDSGRGKPEIQEIMNRAGLQEPYRSRFAKERELNREK